MKNKEYRSKTYLFFAVEMPPRENARLLDTYLISDEAVSAANSAQKRV
jgi:hypothetical protein